MELLGIGPLELLVIILIALIIFSPKDIAKGGKMIGRWINRLYRSDTWKSMRQVSQEMQNLPNRLAREAQLDELKDLEKDLNPEGGSPYANRPAAGPVPPAENKPAMETPGRSMTGPEAGAPSNPKVPEK